VVIGGARNMTTQLKQAFPLLPLRGMLVYPTMVLHLDVGREQSIEALEQAMMDDHIIFLATQKDLTIDNPTQDDIYEMGTLTKVKQMLKLPNGTIRVLVEGLKRAKIVEFIEEEDFFSAKIQTFEDKEVSDTEEEALMRTTLDYFEQYIKLSQKISAEAVATVSDIREPGRLADIIVSHLPLKLEDKQEILETIDVKKRLIRVIEMINNEREVLSLE